MLTKCEGETTKKKWAKNDTTEKRYDSHPTRNGTLSASAAKS